MRLVNVQITYDTLSLTLPRRGREKDVGLVTYRSILRRFRLKLLSAVAAFADRTIVFVANGDAFGGCGVMGKAITFPFTVKIKYLLSGDGKIVHEIAFGAVHHELVGIIFVIAEFLDTTRESIELLCEC